MNNLRAINILLRTFLITILFGLSMPINAATYKLTFTSLWNGSQVEGGVLPRSAHFTTLTGATHQPGKPIWSPGSLASKGIENVAETANTTILKQEINSAIAAGTAGAIVSVGGSVNPLASVETFFDIFPSHSNVSFISMLVPSPDWFVGISDVSLNSGGSWVKNLSLDIKPWDAGTEEGNRFTFSNPATDPHQNISLRNGSPFIGSPTVGNITFELIAVPLPGTLILFMTGLSGLFVRQFIRKGQKY